jgi:hypothetical protein
MELEAEKLLEALEARFADRVRELIELGARHGVEPDAAGVEAHLALMTEAWRQGLGIA